MQHSLSKPLEKGTTESSGQQVVPSLICKWFRDCMWGTLGHPNAIRNMQRLAHDGPRANSSPTICFCTAHELRIVFTFSSLLKKKKDAVS